MGYASDLPTINIPFNIVAFVSQIRPQSFHNDKEVLPNNLSLCLESQDFVDLAKGSERGESQMFPVGLQHFPDLFDVSFTHLLESIPH